MAVESALAQAGEVLAASENARRAQAREKFARVANRFARVCRDRARTHHAPRSFKGEIEHGSEVNVKSQSAAVFANHLPVLTEEFAIAGGEHIRCRRCWAEHVAKSIHAPAFEIAAGEKRRGNVLLAIAEESAGLLGGLYVPCKENDPGRLKLLEQGTEACGYLRAVEADDQKLADMGACLSLCSHSINYVLP